MLLLSFDQKLNGNLGKERVFPQYFWEMIDWKNEGAPKIYWNIITKNIPKITGKTALRNLLKNKVIFLWFKAFKTSKQKNKIKNNKEEDFVIEAKRNPKK